MKIIITSFLLLVSGAVAAADISVGGTSIKIPAPQGFAAVTPEMSALYEFQKKFVAPTNVEFQVFISEKDVLVALKDEIPDLKRRFAVQTAKSLVNTVASKADFSQLKEIIKTQNDEIFKKAKSALGETMGKINEDISEQYDVDLALSVSQIVPLPAHEETDRSLAYSSYVKYVMKDEKGNPAPFVAVVTATFVHIKGKILFLYSYAGESDLDWSKRMSAQWASSVVEANPSDLQSSIKESLPSAVTRIDWEQVVGKALVGAVIGLIIGLIGWLVKRGKAS